MSLCDNCIHDEVCGLEDNHDDSLIFCNDRIPKTDVLDKIRVEISSLIAEYDARCNRFHHKPYKPTKGFPENGVAPRNPIEIESRKWGERAEGLERALKIIDKYKAESEEQA